MEKLIEKFYTALNNRDANTMISCYHENIIFEDLGFGKLKGKKAKAMWQMLCENAKNFKVEFSHIQANDHTGSAHWEAWYTFIQTGRYVHNKIDAQFEFKDGKIIKHTDHFNLHKWASQSLGWKGVLLGRTNFFKKKLVIKTHKMLDKFMSSRL